VWEHNARPLPLPTSKNMTALQKGKGIRASETQQPHRGQPVVCLVHTVAVRSQFMYPTSKSTCSKTMVMP